MNRPRSAPEVADGDTQKWVSKDPASGPPSDRADRTPDPTPDCLSCGACCASFRVDFAAEELLSNGGHVPDGLAVTVTSHTCRMRGTDHSPPRCAALTGRVGERAPCGVYEWRPSPCREFEAGSDACWRARRRHGLPTPREQGF